MSWWQTLVVATVPALVTLGGLMLQLRFTQAAEADRRAEDAAERTADRVEQAAAESRARQAALEDHWRDERHRAHDELLRVLQETISELSAAFTRMPVSPDGDVLGGNYEEVLQYRDDLRGQLSAAVSRVNLCATEDSRIAAVVCWDAIGAFDEALFEAIVLPPVRVTKMRVLRDMLSQVSALRGEYVNSVRQELGTV